MPEDVSCVCVLDYVLCYQQWHTIAPSVLYFIKCVNFSSLLLKIRKTATVMPLQQSQNKADSCSRQFVTGSQIGSGFCFEIFVKYEVSLTLSRHILLIKNTIVVSVDNVQASTSFCLPPVLVVLLIPSSFFPRESASSVCLLCRGLISMFSKLNCLLLIDELRVHSMDIIFPS